jgi:hypothetical protein
MARRIIDYNGTVVGVGGAYPYGDIKDNPSGTIIDRTSNADLQQFFQKLLAEAGITGNGLADNVTNGYQLTEAMSKVISNHAAQIVRSLIGGTYDPTKVYILWGCETRSDGGYCLYDGEIWVIGGNTGFPCGGGLVDVLAFTSPTIYTGGVQALQLVCAASGSGIANFADFIYVNKWVDVRTTITIGSGAGGSFTVDLPDIIYAKYLLRGKTVTFQMLLRDFSITSSPAFMTVTLPFLPSDIAEQMYYLGGVYFSPAGFVKEPLIVETQNAATEFIKIYSPASGWTAGTDDSGLSVSITFEIL